MSRKPKKKNVIATLTMDRRPEGYKEWLQTFEGNEGIPALLEQLARKGVNLKRVRTLLYAAPLMGSYKFRDDLDKLAEDLAAAKRHLDDLSSLLEPYPFRPKQRIWTLGMVGWVRKQIEEQRQLLAEWRSAFSTIQVTDLMIAMVARDLERAGSRKVNEELATLLTAASVPGGTRDEVTNGWAWDAATVHKRRARLKRKPVAVFGPFRNLFENVNIKRIAQDYPELFVKAAVRQEAKATPSAASSQQAPTFARFLEGYVPLEASCKGSSEELPEPPGRDKNSLKES